jgi:hypothetical protein
LVQTSTPQQSALLVHASPVPRQPHVPLALQTLGAQQSPLLVQDTPEPTHPHVEVVVSQLRAPQHSPLFAQPWPPDAQPHVPFTQSAEQHSLAAEQLVPSSLHDPVPPSLPVPGS